MAAGPSLSPAVAQQGFFSAEGELTAGGGTQDFFFNLNSPVNSSQTFGFSTLSDTGGVNSAGDAVADSNFDSVLELTKPFDGTFSVVNDDGGSGRNSLLSWEGVATSTPGAFLPSPLDATSYRLRLREFNTTATGTWSVDMVTPLNSFVLTAIGDNGDSELNSLKFGTDGPSATPALFEYTNGSTLVIREELGVGSSGNGTLTQTAGTITSVGPLNVGSGGIVNLNGGTMNLGNQLSSISGTVNVDGGNLALAGVGRLRTITGGELNVNSGAVDFGQQLSIDGGSTANIDFENATVDLGFNQDHQVINTATLNTFGTFGINNRTDFVARDSGKINAESLRIGFTQLGNTRDGTMTVTKPGSRLVITQTTFVGDTGGLGTLTVSEQATAALGTLVIAGDPTAGTQGTVNLETGAVATAGFIFIADLGTDSPGELNLSGSNTSLTQSGSVGLILGQASGGTGTVNVGLNSTFSTGTGNSTVNPTGTVDVEGGTLNLNGNTTISGGTIKRTFRLGIDPGQINLAAGKTLTVQDGGTLTTGSTGAGLLNAVNKTVTVTGAGSSFNILRNTNGTGGELQITADATVNVQAGGIVHAHRLKLDHGTLNASGSSNDGAGTFTFDTTGSIGGMGSAKPATLNVNLMGEVNTGSGTLTIGSGGLLRLTQGTLNANGDIDVNSGQFNQSVSFDTAFNLAAGKDITVRNEGLALFFAPAKLNQGSQYTVQSGSTLSFAESFDLGDTSTGTLVVDGEDSLASIGLLTSRLRSGFNGGRGDATFRNQGTGRFFDVELASGAAANSQATWRVESGASLQVDNLNLAADGGNGSNASLTVTGVDSVLTNRLGDNSVINIGHATQGSATLTIENGAEYIAGERTVFPQKIPSINATGTVNANGSRFIADTINLNGGTFNHNSGVLDFDTFNGDYTQNGGTLTPNLTDRSMTIDGAYELIAGGIEFTLAEGEDGSISADSIDLGSQGSLKVLAEVLPTSQFALGDTFTILQSDTAIVGTFASEDIVTFNNRTFEVIYNPLSVVLEVVAALTLAGDYNGNGVVDAADYTVWADNFGSMIDLDADGNGNGVVDAADYTIWADNFGTGAPASQGAGAIPEPSSLALLSIIGAGLSLRRCRG
ncbi:MAG: PEP-CTERM sorting domain-containing protein [Planctomycetota bacterium]